MRDNVIPPGFASVPLHRHREAEEAFYVLEGTLSVVAGRDRIELPPGAFLLVPRGLPHALANVGDQPTPGTIRRRGVAAGARPVRTGDPGTGSRLVGCVTAQAGYRRGMQVLKGAGHATPTDSTSWVEHLTVEDLSCGTYSIAAGAADPQDPHTEDELYVCTRGQATLWTPTGSAAVQPGTVIFVPAGEEHRFVDVEADLTVLVMFGPAEDSRKPDGSRGAEDR